MQSKWGCRFSCLISIHQRARKGEDLSGSNRVAIAECIWCTGTLGGCSAHPHPSTSAAEDRATTGENTWNPRTRTLEDVNLQKGRSPYSTWNVFKTMAFTRSLCIRSSRNLISSLTYISRHVKTLHSTHFLSYPPHKPLFFLPSIHLVRLICKCLYFVIMFLFSSVTQSYPTLCDPMDCSTSGFPVHHELPEFTQTNVHWVGDTIEPSHPLSSPSLPALNPSQHQGLFQWVSSLHQVAKVLEFLLQHQSFQWIFRTDFL